MHHLATLSLVQLNDEMRPVNHASGCMVRFGGQLFVLTVFHAVGNQRNWAVEIAFEPAVGQTRLYQLGSMGFLQTGRIKGQSLKVGREVDFAYKLLPEAIHPRDQKVSAAGEILEDRDKVVLETELEATPDPAETYGFWGLVRHNLTPMFLHAEPKHETGLKYERDEGDRHFFRCSVPYRSYDDYRGCSGAPILDSTGRLVSLVVEGDKKKTGIFGLNLARYRSALTVELIEAGLAG